MSSAPSDDVASRFERALKSGGAGAALKTKAYQVAFCIKIDEFVFKMMDFVLTMMNSVL